MIKWGRKKTSSCSLISNVSWFLRFKKTKDGVEAKPKSRNVSLESSRSFKKMVMRGQTIREFISEESGLKWKKSRKGKVGFAKQVEKVGFENKPRITIHATDQDCRKSTVDYSRTANLNLQEEREKLKNMKTAHKSVDIGKETHGKRSKYGRKVNAYSPRIRALEGMKMKKMMNTKNVTKDSFAIVKSSYDLQRDFRESMMEMIIKKRIKQRKELEELLACYLILNCDEYHDIIVKAFQRVWFELNQVCFDSFFWF